MKRDFELFCESFFAANGSARLTYDTLSEATKSKLTKEMITLIYKSVKNKTNEMDYSYVESTKGDITKLKDYHTLDESIRFLNIIANKSRVHSKDLDVINLAFTNIKNNKASFIAAFKQENEIVMLYYNNLVLALSYAVSYTIANMIEYTKNPNGTFETSFKDKSNTKLQNNFIKVLSEFNSLVNNGKFSAMMTKTLGKKQLISATPLAIVIGILSILATILPTIRYIVYFFYKVRIDISDVLRIQAGFIETNINSPLMQNESAKKKQQKIYENMMKMADKIDVETKVNDKQVQMEISSEDKAFTKSAIDNTDFTTVDNTNGSGSSNDILL